MWMLSLYLVSSAFRPIKQGAALPRSKLQEPGVLVPGAWEFSAPSYFSDWSLPSETFVILPGMYKPLTPQTRGPCPLKV